MNDGGTIENRHSQLASRNVCSAVGATNLNDDGATDIAVVSANENTLTIYMGKGDGTFQGARSFPTGW